jgi:hypothetical protein
VGPELGEALGEALGPQRGEALGSALGPELGPSLGRHVGLALGQQVSAQNWVPHKTRISENGYVDNVGRRVVAHAL